MTPIERQDKLEKLLARTPARLGFLRKRIEHEIWLIEASRKSQDRGVYKGWQALIANKRVHAVSRKVAENNARGTFNSAFDASMDSLNRPTLALKDHFYR